MDKMRGIKEIKRPELDKSEILTAVELNNIRFSMKHAVLTPELLEEKRGKGAGG